MEDKQLNNQELQETASNTVTDKINFCQDVLSSAMQPPLEPSAKFDFDNEQQKASLSEISKTSNAEIMGSIQQLMGEMHRLREDFETKVKYDESKERLIDKLHKELQTYRDGIHFKILRPIFMDLISMHDDLDRILEVIAAKEYAIPSSMVRNWQSFQGSIEETLRRSEVHIFTVEDEMYVSEKQRILKVIEVGDPVQDRRIARRVHKGFEYDGRLLRQEMVDIYRFNSSLQVKESEA